MKKVKKVIIPAAGLGTRFLPATKTVPKEMLPIVDKPTILYNVEEAVNAGIEEIILIAGRGKTAIEDFFDMSYELEDHLRLKGKQDLLDRVSYIKSMCDIISVRQKEPKGLGHAILCGQKIVGDEPFAVILGDELMITEKNERPVIGQLMDKHQSHAMSAVAIMGVPKQEVNKYGIADLEAEIEEGLFKIKDLIEKPLVDKAPSNFALPGRYVFENEIFEHIKQSKPGANGEINLTEGMLSLAQAKGMLAYKFKGRRYDAGDKLGYLIANIELALDREDLSPGLIKYIKTLAGKL